MTTSPDPSARSDPGPDYPVVLHVSGRPCLVVGGGPVAARRAEGLLTARARVTVVAPRVAGAIEALATANAAAPAGDAGSLHIEHRPYRAGEVAGYQMVVTATGVPAVDRAVAFDAEAAGVLVASADRTVPGTVRLPAVLRRGPVTVAVSTGGSSPALARWLRNRIAAVVPPEVAEVAELVEEARGALRRAGRPTDSVDWEAVIGEEIVPLVEAGRIDQARSRLGALVADAGPTTEAG